jgi:hypothetical protein
MPGSLMATSRSNRVSRPVDLAHSAFAQLLEDAIGTKAVTDIHGVLGFWASARPSRASGCKRMNAAFYLAAAVARAFMRNNIVLFRGLKRCARRLTRLRRLPHEAQRLRATRSALNRLRSALTGQLAARLSRVQRSVAVCRLASSLIHEQFRAPAPEPPAPC